MIIIGNSDTVIRAKLDTKLSEALKRILAIKKETAQDLIENYVRTYVLDNIELVMSNKGNMNER